MPKVKTPILVAGLVLAVAATIGFSILSFRGTGHVRPELVAEAPIAGWMTPGYVGHSWDVPRKVIIDALALEGGGRHGPLRKIADQRGVPLDDLIIALESAIAAHRAGAK